MSSAQRSASRSPGDNPLQVAIIGECMIELRHTETGIVEGFGGDTLNTAVYLMRSAQQQLGVSYVTALGKDGFSDNMLAAWQQEGIDTSLIQRFDNKLPGLYVIETDPNGERRFHYWRNDAAARYWLDTAETNAILETLMRMDVLYLSGISLAILAPAARQKLIDVLISYRSQGGKVIFDNNYRPRLWENPEATQHWYQQMLQATDIAFLTLDDEDMLWGSLPVADVISRTQAAGVKEVVIKRGAESCLVMADGQLYEVPAVRVLPQQVVDTTAAGDSFSAGYLAARLCGDSVEQAAAAGHRLASTVIQHRGAIIPMQSMPQV